MDARGQLPTGDPDAGRLAYVVHATFVVLLAAATVRFVQRHGSNANLPAVIVLALLLAVLYVAISRLRPLTAPQLPVSWPPAGHLAVLVPLVAVWAALVSQAPSFAWVAVPLIYVTLHTLPLSAAFALIAVLTLFAITAQLTLAGRFDLDLVVGPAAVVAFATAVFARLQRLAVRQRSLIDDLIRTRRELAATERRAGVLTERQRLSMEIHDTLAQGLSSQRMLLQAATRVWDADPVKAHGHIRTAATIADHNLAEARRFVHDLAPADLAEGSGLPEALRTLASRESDAALTVRVHIDDHTGVPLPDRVQSALLRIAQGALANVREHAQATTATLTLTTLEDEAVLDVADDGRGFDRAARPSTAVRGHGIPAINARLRQLGGTLTIDSAPGEGTVLTAAIPLEQPQ
ncbi:sensor histidine kinase [Streptomyces sp. NA04227]|uniref:sensor histidine kinase n=1 Tax=Streptomyces sp. NA04227 TaxID=2742136 RepID=UPI0015913DB5|nr:sensor histidine kinase [Streptomyces sp. NA04227]QKW10408.1 sensor histidine kinase [Streptomyces sp. NA04227]